MEQALRHEYNFFMYLRKLHAMIDRVNVFIVANDSMAGPGFTPEVSFAIKRNLGLQQELADKFRLSYAAAISLGKVVFEQLAPNQQEPVVATGEGIRLVSACLEVHVPGYSTAVEINGINFAHHGRGLNFVVQDANTGNVLDSSIFDTYSPDLHCIKLKDHVECLRNYELRKQIKLICFNFPTIPTENLLSNEAFIRANNLTLPTFQTAMDELIRLNQVALLDFFDSKADILQLINPPESYLDIYGVRQYKDTHTKLVNTVNGIRVTSYQPYNYKRSIFLTGDCRIFGIGTDDSRTIASLLQDKLNEEVPSEQFIVHNYGHCLGREKHIDWDESYKILENIPAEPGDVVIFSDHNYAPPNAPELTSWDFSTAAQRPHEYGKIFFDCEHLPPAGYQLVADKLFACLKDNDFFPAEQIISSAAREISGGGTQVLFNRTKTAWMPQSWSNWQITSAA